MLYWSCLFWFLNTGSLCKPHWSILLLHCSVLCKLTKTAKWWSFNVGIWQILSVKTACFTKDIYFLHSYVMLISLTRVLPTCSVLLLRVTAFPSISVGDMVTAPLAVASSDTNSCPSPLPMSGTSLASTLFRLEERVVEDPVILDKVTRDDGLGDSFSLKKAQQSNKFTKWKKKIVIPQTEKENKYSQV